MRSTILRVLTLAHLAAAATVEGSLSPKYREMILEALLASKEVSKEVFDPFKPPSWRPVSYICPLVRLALFILPYSRT